MLNNMYMSVGAKRKINADILLSAQIGIRDYDKTFSLMKKKQVLILRKIMILSCLLTLRDVRRLEL